jgi:hypothetical protein
MDPQTRAAWLAARTKHGAYAGGKETPEHYTWRTMHARCKNPNAASYPHYGGRGISVCIRWGKFENFLADMGPRPGPGYSLERKNTQQGYRPSNCRWATRSEQQKNKTTTRWFSDGEFSGTLVECAAYLHISKSLALWRWKTWGTFEKGKKWRQLQRAS